MVALAAGLLWVPSHPSGCGQETGSNRISLHDERVWSGPKGLGIPAAVEDKGLGEQEDANPRESLRKAFTVERVDRMGDPGGLERATARRDYYRVKAQIEQAGRRGLEGEDLYRAVEDVLQEDSGEGLLEMLAGFRVLEEELSKANLDAMSPREKHAYRYAARRRAFGDETADMLFLEEEAFTRYKLETKAVRDDASLTEEERESKIRAFRRFLKVELASTGASIVFADE